MEKKLNGRVAIVTGASKGIGAEIAIELAREGASVVVNYSSSKEGAEKVVESIQKEGGKAVAIQANLSKPEEVKKLFVESKKSFGKLDILVNNAGVYEFLLLEDITVEHYHKIFDLNVLGLILASQEAVKYFSDKGSIINISSVVSRSPSPSGAIYNASKAAVDSFTKTLAKELGPKIRVNSVNPGLVKTEGTNSMNVSETGFEKEYIAKEPLGRVGQVADIAPAVVFLASDDSSWMTGESIFISGGV